ncbi:MAG: PAS domain S-box protein [Proteobacteria bacterium]|nr:PAS domain S-box protein [Pseudomonadota bacterium]
MSMSSVGLSTAGFMPHGMCYLWRWDVLSLHVLSDALISLAYFSIPFTLVYFVRKRRDLEFDWMFLCFAIFIIACGLTHVLEIWTIWHPDYWLSGSVKAVTALASVPTAVLLVRLLPQALQLPSPSSLARVNERLERQITERAQSEANLRVSEERFRRAFDDAPIGMALVAPSGQWLRVNRALCEMLDYPEADLLRTDFQSLTYPDDLETDLSLMARALAGELPSFQLEKRYLDRHDRIVYALLSVSLVRDRHGTPLYFVSQIENVGHRREMDRLKSEFVSSVSHELRTPLTSIRGSLGLLSAGVLGELSERARHMVRIALSNCERLVGIINNILDIEKIGAGRLTLELQRVDAGALLRRAVEANEPYAAKYEVRIRLADPGDGLEVQADPERLMQVLANLLSNAAKFSPAGSEVTVRASPSGEAVRFEIADPGQGIPEEFRGRVFERFAQADASNSRSAPGTGLGLYISRQLIEAMHGTIGFSSATGEGTTFYFELPRATHGNAERSAEPRPDTAAASAGVARPPTGEPAGLPRILHAEDDPDLAQVVATLLAGRATVVHARTLAAARAELERSSFSLLLVDPGLPDGDGLALLDAPAGRELPPVVVLSVSEIAPAIQRRVAAALVKSRTSEARIAEIVLSRLRVPRA